MDGWGGVPCVPFPVSLRHCLGVLSLPAGSLSALVYQHSVIPLALPCKLVIPSRGRKYSLMLSAQNGARTEAIQGTPPPSLTFFFFKEEINCPLITRLFSKVLWLFKKFHTEFSERGQSHEDYILVHERTSSVR